MEGDLKHGVTAPMSVDPPTQKELELDEALVKELKARGQFEAPEETERRHNVLARLQAVLKQLVIMIGKQQGLPPGIVNEAGGKIFTFGSFELGVYGPRSDMDTLMLAPKHVSRDDFFQHVPDLLRMEFKPEEITELTAVPGISVPIIKLELCGVSVDLIFCNLKSLQSVPKTQELDDLDLLRGLDDTDLKCVNGTRVTKRILDVVPQTRTFRTALRAIKLWAKERALYGNIVGYPGGVAYAMMVARICQIYPKAAASTIIEKFFYIMRNWNWPSPVLLQNREEGPLNLREWDPQVYGGDRRHLMPIITPRYPRANAAHTIGPSTKTVLLWEMERGGQLVRQIQTNGRPWSDLFQRQTFFSNAFKHYICVITSSRTKEAQQAWSGLVESKLKWLIQGVEQSDADNIELVQPFNKGFNRVHECPTDEEVIQTQEGSLEWKMKEVKTQTTVQEGNAVYQAAAQTDTDGQEPDIEPEKPEPETTDGPYTIWTTTFYLGIQLNKRDEAGGRKLDISKPIQDFLTACKEWQNYNVDMHCIMVKHLRNHQLPDDVFAEGEKRPTQKKKKKKKGNHEMANGDGQNGAQVSASDDAIKKRSAEDAGLNDNGIDDSAKRRQSGNDPRMGDGVNGGGP